MCTDVFGDILSGIIAVGAAALAPVTGGASLLVAAGAGAVSKVGIKAFDSAAGGKKYELQDFGYDVITGSINGFMAPLSNAIGGAAGTGVAKALGLNALETTAKTTLKEAGCQGVKGFLSNLLAKQGAKYVLKEGAKGGAKAVLATAAAYGVDMTIDGALSGAADAFSRKLAAGDIENAPGEILKGAAFGALGGLLIGGSTRLVFKSASKLRSALSGADSISPESSVSGAARASLFNDADIDFSKPIKPDSKEASKIAEIISKQNEALKSAAVKEFEDATAGSSVQYSSRAKGFESTLNKLNSKLKDGAVITSLDDAYNLIADGVGTRALFKNLTGDEALLALKNAGISDSEIDILKSIWSKNRYDGLDEASLSLLARANRVLSEAQTGDFVSRLSKAIENNEISITEINNYAGDSGIAYFTDDQILQIYKAWEKSAQDGDFSIVTKTAKDSKLAQELGFDPDYIEEISKKSAKASGYTACQSNFKYSNGALGEGQFRGAEIDSFAEYEHFPYDIKKGKTTVQKKIDELILAGKNDVADELSEYQDLVRVLAKDKDKYARYNAYLSDFYNYLRKKELGILDITGQTLEPKLQIDGLSPHQIELLSKECLESLSKKEFYTFKNP